MDLILRFPLAEVMTIVEHAVLTEHVSRDYGAPAHPALLLIADNGIYLRSNARPALPGQPWHWLPRQVFAEGYGPGGREADWRTATNNFFEGAVTNLPLRGHGGSEFVDVLREKAGLGFDTLTFDTGVNPIPVCVTHRDYGNALADRPESKH